MQRLFYAVLLLLAITLAACNDGGDIQLTLVNQNLALSTEIASVRSTATYAADELDITAEYVSTAMRQVTQQYDSLVRTLAAVGIDASQLQPGAFVPTSTPLAQQPVVTSGSSDPLAAASVAAMSPTPQAGASLYNVVTASGVGANDCALGSVSSFTTTTEQIYVVATASNIPANTTLSSRWFNEGVEAVAHSFTPDFDIQQSCIWFYIDQSDTPFTPGNWSVQLEINGQPAGQPVTFSITG